MDLDLAQFHATFFDESFEALDSMEAALLKLDVGAPSPEGINTVFRVAHSIKGGAGMFGFKDVASFTHTLETLLDELRSGKMHVRSDLFSAAFPAWCATSSVWPPCGRPPDWRPVALSEPNINDLQRFSCHGHKTKT